MSRFLVGPGRALTRFGERPRYQEGLYELGRGAYAWLVPNGSWGETNLGLVVCGRQSVLIDTCWDLRYLREALSAAETLVQAAPIEHVINTHADGDHCWGNQLFEGKPILASEGCVRQFAHVQPWQSLRLARLAKRLAHVPFAGLDAFGHYMQHMFEPYDFRQLRLTPPTQSFRGEHALRVAQAELLLTETGPGHTEGDCTVFLPDAQVLYAGDILFVESTPVAWSGPVENLVAALRRVLELRPAAIVPGHGRLATPADVQAVIDYWEFVQSELWPRCRAGMPSHEAARDVVFSPRFRESAFARWDSPERLVTSARTLYRGWGVRESRSHGALGVMTTLHRQAGLALAMPDASPRIMHRFDRGELPL